MPTLSSLKKGNTMAEKLSLTATATSDKEADHCSATDRDSTFNRIAHCIASGCPLARAYLRAKRN